jgi:hypothetical protein
MARAWFLVVLLALALPQAARADARADQLTTLINRARAAGGASPLARSAALDAAAQAHSLDMVVHNYLDHTGFDASQPQERAERAGYHVPPHSGWIVVEVISAISDDPAEPVDWWFNQSPDVHGRVLRDPRWREMGVGYAEGGEYGHYWTVLVGCRPGALATVVLDGKSYEQSERCGDPASVPPSLTVSVTAASDLEVRWAGIASPTERDWLGLYRVGDPDGSYLRWEYVSCSSTPLVARASGWCWLRVPAGQGVATYEVQLHSNDSTSERLASSGPVAVTGSAAATSNEGPEQFLATSR